MVHSLSLRATFLVLALPSVVLALLIASSSVVAQEPVAELDPMFSALCDVCTEASVQWPGERVTLSWRDPTDVIDAAGGSTVTCEPPRLVTVGGGFAACVAGAENGDDWNRDAVPDACQWKMELRQLSWFDVESDTGELVPTQELSDYGQLLVTLPEGGEDSIRFFNALVGSGPGSEPGPPEWLVRNAPLAVQQDDEGAPLTAVFTIPLSPGTPTGAPAPPNALVWAFVTPDEVFDEADLRERAGASEPALVPVSEQRPYYCGGAPAAAAVPANGSEPQPGGERPLFFPPAAGRPAGGAPHNSSVCEVFGRPHVPGVSEALNHCVPGAHARSLAWMTQALDLQPPDGCNLSSGAPASGETFAQRKAREAAKIAECWQAKLATAMGTNSANGTLQFGVPGVRQCLADEGVDGQLSVEARLIFDGVVANPLDMLRDLKLGYDVMAVLGRYRREADGRERRVGGHQVTVTGASQKGPRFSLWYRDDCDGANRQGDGRPDSGVNHGGMVLSDPTTWSVDIFGDAMRYDGYIRICPTPNAVSSGAYEWADGLSAQLNSNSTSGNDAPEALFRACQVRDNARALLEQTHARAAAGKPVPPMGEEETRAVLADAESLKAGLKTYVDAGLSLPPAQRRALAARAKALSDRLLDLDLKWSSVGDE